MSATPISINRAPVLTLWATVVAQRLGFKWDEALTLGKAVAGLNAQARGRRLGIFKPDKAKAKKAREKEPGERFLVDVCGRAVAVINTEEGVRALTAGKPIQPAGVERYLQDKFSDELGRVRTAMQKLAKSYKPGELAIHAYALYEQFRPDIPAGTRGWGAAGDLDLDRIVALANKS